MGSLDHIAFLVPKLEAAQTALSELGLAVGPTQTFAAEGTRESYVGPPDASGRILLIEAVADGPYSRALAQRGPGLHHVALTVADLDAFVGTVVDGSGWLLHPRSFQTREHGVAWLARPGVDVLVELQQGGASVGGGVVDEVVVAGLDAREGLAALFADAGRFVAGPRSGAVVSGQFVAVPGEAPEMALDPFEYNRAAWDRRVAANDRWTVGVSPEAVQQARDGDVHVVLTPRRRVPREWLGELSDLDVLCLASGGGQQGPVLAAAGANVTVFDASDAQLGRDREVATREGLDLRTVQGDMRDLAAFDDAVFDLIVHPCSNCFVEEILPVWRESFRVLRGGGHLLSGFNNPIGYCFDWSSVERGIPRLAHRLPYRDLDHLDDPYVRGVLAAGDPLEFSHTLTEQLGGQTAAGFAIVDLYEDGWGADEFPDRYFDGFIATRALKPVS